MQYIFKNVVTYVTSRLDDIRIVFEFFWWQNVIYVNVPKKSIQFDMRYLLKGWCINIFFITNQYYVWNIVLYNMCHSNHTFHLTNSLDTSSYIWSIIDFLLQFSPKQLFKVQMLRYEMIDWGLLIITLTSSVQRSLYLKL